MSMVDSTHTLVMAFPPNVSVGQKTIGGELFIHLRHLQTFMLLRVNQW